MNMKLPYIVSPIQIIVQYVISREESRRIIRLIFEILSENYLNVLISEIFSEN